MNIEEREEQYKAELAILRQEIEARQQKAGRLESKLELIAEMKLDANGHANGNELSLVNNLTESTNLILSNENPSVGAALVEAMRALKNFTKPAAVALARQTYPTLEFSDKSIQRPLKELMNRGEVKIIKSNHGSKTLKVYGFVK